MPPVSTNNFRDKSKKFIGGAEVARRKARLPKNSKANKLKKAKNVKKFKSHNFKHPMEIFYSSLLKCNVEDLLKSNKNSDVRKQILHDILDRAGMPPIAKLPSSYENYVEYYSLKASLVLEEARCQISQELSVLRQRNQTQNVFSNNDQLHLTLVKVKPKKQSGNIVLLLEKTHHNINQYTANHHNSFTYFTPKEQYNMKPGCLHEMCFLPPQQRFGPGYVATAITYVQPLHNFGNQVGHPTGNARVQLVMCNTSEISESLLHEGSRWYFYPLTTMISCQRQFEGCVRFAQVPFMSKLCAWKEGTHIRFDDEGNEEFSINTESSAIEKKKRPTNEINKAVDNTIFQLNESQETAASKFLRSPTSSLTLVQGPPGTGKTTFLVSVIYRCLLQKNGKSFNMNKRVMVTAPTNRAVTVLANRFLDLVEKECEPNLILIGVEDKLLDDADANVLVDSKEDPFTVASLSPSLRSIYVYTWLGNIIKMYHDLGYELSLLLDSNNALSRVTDVASMLNNRLSRGIPILYKKSGAFVPCQELEEFLSEVAESFTENIDETKIKWQQTQILAKSKHIINKAISFLRTIQSTEAIHELLSTANVIFCTLSTAGTSFLKSTNKIDDLFVDEAAAASEAELCIPFHLLPQRMLAVGDPKQLPVTLLSQEATQNGLGKSLHERLMYDCGKEHLMLQIQYRMRPEISMFPSAQFYGGKISDGGNVLSEHYRNPFNMLNGVAYSFHDVIGKEERSFSGSYYNMKEAITVVGIIQILARKAKRADWGSSEKVRIITFYQGQVSCIKNLLQRKGLGSVLVATVDSSQGSEAETIIISFVRSTDKIGSEYHTTAGFLADDRRLNVALTRAKYQLICVGNTSSILHSGVPTLKALITNAKERSCIVTSI